MPFGDQMRGVVKLDAPGAFIVASTSLQPYQIVPGVSAFR